MCTAKPSAITQSYSGPNYPSIQPNLTLQATSIVVSASSLVLGEQSALVTLFNPTQETFDKLKSLKRGDRFHGVTMIDVFDDDTFDTHVNQSIFEFLSMSSGDGRKQHTQQVSFLVR